jgi:ABC-type polysaccharide/polyol phosphate export permease
MGIFASAGAARRLSLCLYNRLSNRPDEWEEFLLFVAIALWPWLAAQEALSRGTSSIAGYAGLIRKVAFPHELIVYASVTASLALQFAGYLAVLVVLSLFGEPVRFEGLLLRCPYGSSGRRGDRVSRWRCRLCRCSSGTSSTS